MALLDTLIASGTCPKAGAARCSMSKSPKTNCQVLYGQERISIHPKNFSVRISETTHLSFRVYFDLDKLDFFAEINLVKVGMFSWFPIFFPLRHPQFVPKGGIIRSQQHSSVSFMPHAAYRATWDKEHEESLVATARCPQGCRSVYSSFRLQIYLSLWRSGMSGLYQSPLLQKCRHLTEYEVWGMRLMCSEWDMNMHKVWNDFLTQRCLTT